jgi:hypothetical protein
MSAEMRNFMEAYAAVHSNESREDLNSKKDPISEMNLSALNHLDFVDISEEIFESILKDNTLSECIEIIEGFIPETDNVGRSRKVDRITEAFTETLNLILSKSTDVRLEEFAKHRQNRIHQESWSERMGQNKSAKRLHERLVAHDKLNVKQGLLQMIEAYKELTRDKRNTMFRKAGNLSRTALQGGDKGTEAGKKSGKIVKALNKDAEKYNRNDVKEAAKPDYIDLDGDGDKEESMKKAAKDKKMKGMKKESYLETDMDKRKKNNEKARKDMKKMGTSMKNPHFGDGPTGSMSSEEVDSFDSALNILVNEGFSQEDAIYIMANLDCLDESMQDRRNPEKYEASAKKSESKGSGAERRVRDRLKTMDPKAAENMKAQMRAVGLSV